MLSERLLVSKLAQIILMALSYTLHVRNDRDHGMEQPS